MAMIRSFRELQVYQMARKEARAIFVVSKSFPTEEKYSFEADQIRSALFAGC